MVLNCLCSVLLLLLLLQLVPAVTELMVAELLYLEKQGQSLPIEMLINSSGTTRQDGEIVSVHEYWSQMHPLQLCTVGGSATMRAGAYLLQMRSSIKQRGRLSLKGTASMVQ